MKKKLHLLLLTAVFTVLLTATAFAATAPGKVTGLKQIDASNNYIEVQWDAALGQDVYYEVSMSTDGVNWAVEEDKAYDADFYTYNLTAGRTYYVRVRAYVDTWSEPIAYGAYSDAIRVTTAPNKAENVKQTSATASSMTVSWDRVDGATSYEVCKYQNNAEYVVGTTTATSYTITGLNNKIKFPFSVYVRPVRNIGTYIAKDKSAWYSVDDIASYNIKLVPAKVSNVHISNFWNNIKEVSFAFNLTEHADGYVYELYNYKNKKISSGTASTYSTYLKNISGQFYKLRVRAYTTVNTKVLYGEWSDYTIFAQQPKVNIKRSGYKLKVSWKKVKGAKNYTIYMSTKQRSGYKKVATTKKASYKVSKFKKKKLSKKKTYYIYVVANRKIGKKTYKSDIQSFYYLRRY